MHDVSSCHINRDLLAFLVVSRLVERDVEDSQDVGCHHACCRHTTT